MPAEDFPFRQLDVVGRLLRSLSLTGAFLLDGAEHVGRRKIRQSVNAARSGQIADSALVGHVKESGPVIPYEFTQGAFLVGNGKHAGGLGKPEVGGSQSDELGARLAGRCGALAQVGMQTAADIGRFSGSESGGQRRERLSFAAGTADHDVRNIPGNAEFVHMQSRTGAGRSVMDEVVPGHI